jgi:hypothetical protein
MVAVFKRLRISVVLADQAKGKGARQSLKRAIQAVFALKGRRKGIVDGGETPIRILKNNGLVLYCDDGINIRVSAQPRRFFVWGKEVVLCARVNIFVGQGYAEVNGSLQVSGSPEKGSERRK